MTRPTRIVPFFGATMMLLACGNPNFRAAVNAAKDAEQRGDVATAAEQWTRACRIEPTDEEACTRAKGTSTTLRQNSVATAKPLCEAVGTYEACLDTLAQSRGLFPDDPDMNALVDGGAALYVQSCQAKEDTASLTGITGVVACLEKLKGKVARPAYSSLVDQQRKRAAVLCARNFDAPSLAAGHAFRVAARCLDASSESQADVDSAAVKWMTKRRVSLRASVSGGGLTDASSYCSGVAKALGPFASCATSGGILSVSLMANTRLDETRHAVREELKDATFVAGYTQQTNPAYIEAERRVANARQAVRMSDRNTSQYYRQSRESDLQNALRDLQNTPTMVTVPVNETVNYTVRYHNWVTPWAYQLSVAGVSDTAQNSGEAVYDDTENPGIPKANVVADMLQSPTRSTFEKMLFEAAVPAGASLVREHILQKASCAPGDSECVVTRIVYTSGRLPTAREYVGAIPCDGER